MTNIVDENGRKVLAFVSKTKNLTKVAELMAATVEIIESGAWRDYEFATGRQSWRECEFDYFLIAQEWDREDAARVIAWNRKGKEVAALMDPAAPRSKRRTLAQADREWDYLNMSLTEAAVRLKWMPAGAAEITRSDQPVPLTTCRRIAATKRGNPPNRFEVQWTGGVDAGAEAITKKLRNDEALAKAVYNKLRSNLRTDLVPVKSDKRRSAG